MLVSGIATILGVSLLFYCLFAGADLGAGILELFLGRTKKEEQKEIISRAMAPVWEANHLWIILAVVILFNGFPKAFSEISTSFHIPILIMLMGIILRGCAFTFRRYDAVKDKTQKYYSAIFVLSSVVTPMMVGIVAGGLSLGRVGTSATNFYAAYVDPWLNLFCFSVGIFVCSLFAFLAAVYLIGESKNSRLKKIFSEKAFTANILVIIGGAFVFICAQIDDFPLIQLFMKNLISLSCMGMATAILLPLWIALRSQNTLVPRILAAAQFLFVFLGWYSLQYPAILVKQGTSLTLDNTQAPEPTLRLLLYSLIFGMLVIFPALLYLLYTFKGPEKNGISRSHN